MGKPELAEAIAKVVALRERTDREEEDLKTATLLGRAT
jgi:hypothetical protein